MIVSQQIRPAVLFDLDGTLTDPFVGITRSLQYVLEKLGRTVPPAESLSWCIGPPIQSNIAVLLETEEPEIVQEGIRLYRERYAAEGKFENELIEGIPEALEKLAEEGVYLSVATSKLRTFAVEIIDHFGLRGFFDAVHGSELDGTNSVKADLVAHILSSEQIAASQTVMVGDRSHDVVGARANGLSSVGVLWGYGDRQELQDAGATRIASRPSELADLILDARRSSQKASGTGTGVF